MENITLTVVMKEDYFNEAMIFLDCLQENDTVNNPDICDYINQMYTNDLYEEIDEDTKDIFIVTQINFKNELHFKVVCAFWTAVCAETRENRPALYDVGYHMYYSLIMAYEIEKEEGAL